MSSKNTIQDIQALTNTLVRYILAGGVFILAFGYVEGWRLEFLRTGSEGKDISFYLTTLFVAVVGAVAYTLHRALAYRLILPLLMNRLIRTSPEIKDKKTTWLMLDRTLTKIRYESRRLDDPLQHSFDRWAAEIHFLYASSWCVIFAFLFFRLKQAKPGVRDWVLLVLFVILLLAALFHDWYLMREEVHRAYPTEPSPTP